MKEIKIFVLPIAILLIILTCLTYVSGQGQMTHMQNWAAENKFDVVSIEACYFDKGPFWYTDSEATTTYAVKIIDPNGVQRTAYFNFGFFTEQKWQD